jgi:hypothetical protein
MFKYHLHEVEASTSNAVRLMGILPKRLSHRKDVQIPTFTSAMLTENGMVRDQSCWRPCLDATAVKLSSHLIKHLAVMTDGGVEV